MLEHFTTRALEGRFLYYGSLFSMQYNYFPNKYSKFDHMWHSILASLRRRGTDASAVRVFQRNVLLEIFGSERVDNNFRILYITGLLIEVAVV